jgi:hypothetical protein
MSWAKIDDRANEHPKLLEAGAKAAWLWACGLMYCNRQVKKTGRIPKLAVPILFPGVGLPEAKRLVDAGLWREDGKDYVVHDYHPWNPELKEKRAEAGRVGGKRSGESRRAESSKQNEATGEANQEATDEANRSKLLHPNEANQEATDEANRSKLLHPNEANQEATDEATPRAHGSRAPDPPHPTPPREEDPPTPEANSEVRRASKQRPRDPMGDHYAGRRPSQRSDVRELHEAWKKRFKFHGHKLEPGNLAEADILAEAIDSRGLPECLLILEFAPQDGMVSGKADEKGTPHESIGYIFGNQHAAARILRLAKNSQKPTEETVEERFERLSRESA